MASQRASLALVPYGWPPGDVAQATLLACGGDVERVIDRPADDLARFIAHVGRLPAVRDEAAHEPAIVFLTRTSPIPLTVVSARRTLEAKLPSLRRAAWVLFVRAEDDPFFEQGAEQLGLLSAAMTDSPIWIGPDATAYLVTTEKSDLSLLPERMTELRRRSDKLRRGIISTTLRRPPRA